MIIKHLNDVLTLFRSEIAWRDAKYAQIYEYLREEYEVTQRFGNLDFKLKFVEVRKKVPQLLVIQLIILN